MTNSSRLSVNGFKKTIWDYYRQNGRILAWRKTKNPYKILVSEIMLQQTQVDRVSKRYFDWLKQFPTSEALAEAKLKDVLQAWQGLGYNRRALNLKKTAEILKEKYKNKFPKTFEEIKSLPGIGPYTAGAIMAFAFGTSVPIIETNIRTVYIHFFFKKKTNILDADILKLIGKTLDTDNPREWYYALMDYGAMLKKTSDNLNSKSKHYTKQSAFKGSNREIRSVILKAVTNKKINYKNLYKHLEEKNIKTTKSIVLKNIESMKQEGFLFEKNNMLAIR